MRSQARALNALAGLSLIAFMAFAEVVPVASHVSGTPQFFTARLMLAPVWGQVRHLSSLVLIAPALVFLALSLLPGLLRPERRYATWLPGWVPWALVALGLSFFPIAASMKNSVNIGPLWLLFFFTWLGCNLLAQSKDYFFASVVAAFLWDLGAGVQGLWRGIAHLPEPYWNAAPPWLVTSVDLVAIAVVILLWEKGLDPGAIVDTSIDRLRARRAASRSAG